MTVVGWIVFAIIAVVLIIGGVTLGGILIDSVPGLAIGGLIGFILSLFLFIEMFWYYNNTAAGARAYKTQESNFNMGIERKITVYDATGNILKEYEGKFDVEYDDDRIRFDDEKGLRHVIYYPTGTVIIDEVE